MQVSLRSYDSSDKLADSAANENAAPKLTWRVWLVLVLISFVVQVLTLDVLPHIQQDEAQITDYGRLVLQPTSDWGVTWWVAEGKPLLLWSYIGPLIAELSFQISGPSGIGPRLSSLLGGAVAASITLGWLLERRVPVYAALGLSLTFMLDPLFVLSQRMARVDSWVFALCIASCLLLRIACWKDNIFARKVYVMAAGGLAVIAAFTWPTAVFLFPLIALELFQSKTEVIKWREVAGKAVLMGIGGLIVGVLLIIPVWEYVVIVFSDITTMVGQNVDAAKSLQEQLLVLFDYNAWFKLAKALVKTFTPFLALSAILGLFIRREKGIIIATVLTLFIIFSTLIYEFRVLYLLPYFVVLSSGLFTHSPDITIKEDNTYKWYKKRRVIALAVLIIWATATSLVARTVLGLQGRAGLDREKVYQAATSTIGQGDFNVFLGFTYEFYFVGRDLGWHLYIPYIQYSYDSEGNWLREKDYEPKEQFLALLTTMDYAIFSEGSVSKELSDELKASGLHYNTRFWVAKDTSASNHSDKISGTLLWFLKGKESYGSYVLYARAENPLASRE